VNLFEAMRVYVRVIEREGMAKGVTMSGVDRSRRIARLKRVLWFLLLWLFGVGGAALIALPFHLLVVSAVRSQV
jgi:hypothetical protein